MRIPPFCPNPLCHLHNPLPVPRQASFWVHTGRFFTRRSGIVQRFRCPDCGTGFSESTFSIDYYAKKRLDYQEIHRATISSESISSIARHLGCSIESIQNRQDRLGRNCLAFHARVIEGHKLAEDLCADGFESFDRSQYFPNAINILVGKDSQFLYGATHATLRRKGRMTPGQKRRRAAYDARFSIPSGSLTKSFVGLMEGIEPMWTHRDHRPLVLRTDEHPVYPRAITRITSLREGILAGTFVHEAFSSKLPRTVENPLFPVNYYDRELRKDIAAYRRESTCFTRNVANGLMRFSQHMVWHNYRKPHRIVSTAEKPKSHAVVAGLDEKRINRELSRLYSDRAFLSHQALSNEATRIWLKKHPTPLKLKNDYCPRFAMVGYQQASRN